MNRIIDAIREGSKAKLVIAGFDTGEVPGKSSIVCPVDLQEKKVLLKSIEVEASTNTSFRVEFFEEEALLNSRYNSGEVSHENYDVLDLPFINKEDKTMMYVVVYNTSDSTSRYHIEVRGTALK